MSVHQRLGWLDQFTHLICSATTDGFIAGRKYEMQAKNLKSSTLTERVISGQLEEILEVGSEMYVQVHDDLGRLHLFAHKNPPSDPRIHRHHAMVMLIAHFHIPAIPDITAIYPKRYAELCTQLQNL
jgi:hypothetical protein